MRKALHVVVFVVILGFLLALVPPVRVAVKQGWEKVVVISQQRLKGSALEQDAALVAYWKLDEGNGSTAVATKGANATITNPIWTDGKFGRALRFESPGSYITSSVPYLSLSNSSKFSSGFWVRLRNLGVARIQLFGSIDTTSTIASLTVENNKIVLAWYGNDSSGGAAGCGSLSWTQNFPVQILAEQWVHIASTWDYVNSALVRKVYVNGQLISPTPLSCTPGSLAGYPNGNYAYAVLGVVQGLGSQADIDDFHLFSRTLTDDDVRKLGPNPIAYWKLDENYANGGAANLAIISEVNQAPDNNRGFMTGSLQWVPDRDGNDGKAIYFTGGGNPINLGTASNFRVVPAITYAFWTKIPAGGGGYVMGVGANGGSGLGGIHFSANELTFSWTPQNPTADTTIVSSGVTFSPDTWYHIGFGIDYDSGVYKMFVNGNAVSTSISQSISNYRPQASYNSGYQDWIGGRIVNTQQNYKGTLDDIKIFDQYISGAAVMKAIAGISTSPPPPPVCGDGTKQTPNSAGVNEECDLGSQNSDTGACTLSCNNAICGDSKTRAGAELCDDGNTVETDSCIACVDATCGDGKVQTGVEQCEDGNADATDACNVCQFTFCGDGVIQPNFEGCDDGNSVDGDGCTELCKEEAICGNGTIETGAVCTSTDGTTGQCTAYDQITEECDPPGATCTAVCKNAPPPSQGGWNWKN